jgi:hypothetical protein
MVERPAVNARELGTATVCCTLIATFVDVCLAPQNRLSPPSWR